MDNYDNITVTVKERENTMRGGTEEIIDKKLDINLLNKSFVGFVNSLKAIVSNDVLEGSAFDLEEVQFSAEISANGEFKLMGIGVGLEGTRAITFVLRKRQSE